MTKYFFNPKKVQKGMRWRKYNHLEECYISSWRKEAILPKRVTFYIKSSETSTNLKNVVFSSLLIKIWSFQEAFLSLLLSFGNEILKLNTYYELYHCYFCNIILQMIQIQWNLESFIDLIHKRIWSVAIFSQNLQELFHCYIC